MLLSDEFPDDALPAFEALDAALLPDDAEEASLLPDDAADAALPPVSEEDVLPLFSADEPVGDSNEAACAGALLFVISSFTTLDSLPTRR